MISKQSAVLNNVPQGAYVVDVIAASPAERGGIKTNDVITKMDGQTLTDQNGGPASPQGGLATIISKKKPGDKMELEIWRNNETVKLTVTLSEFTE